MSAAAIEPRRIVIAGGGVGALEAMLALRDLGEGAFELVLVAPDDRLVVKKNPSYWEKDASGAQLPYLDELTYKPITDGTQRLNALKTATVDIIDIPASKDMPTLAAQVEVLLDSHCLWGYLIDGHGLYTWGRDMTEARRHLEAFEFLLGCELELRKLHR
jgi:hypothetical protein